MTDFEQHVRFRPSYDYRDDAQDGRGAHGMDIFLALQGPKGAISCRIGTGWLSRPIADPMWNIYAGRPPSRRDEPGLDAMHPLGYPSGMGLSTHVPNPNGTNKCEWLDGRPCSGDTGYLASDSILAALIASGDGVWDEMRAVYDEWLDPPCPDDPDGLHHASCGCEAGE